MLLLCGLFIAFQAGAGFLFGQFFAGHFSFAATLTGIAGLACSTGAFLLSSRPASRLPWLRWAAALALLGLVLDVAEYYMYLAIPGNYYPWLLAAPFAACVAWVGYQANVRQTPGP